ncbi:MAG: hypothetical protein LBU27_04915 [Candidatus Peribacteria bacterium]|jgi:tetratricopeptide (TPR) repeat protein|nr:hypothetical protein [Candidatus Peribacteria bacterium]
MKRKGILLNYDILFQKLKENPLILTDLLQYVEQFEEAYQKAEKELDDLLQQSISLRQSEQLQDALNCLIEHSGVSSWKKKIKQKLLNFFEEEIDATPEIKRACNEIKRKVSQLQHYQNLIKHQKEALEKMHKEYTIFECHLCQLHREEMLPTTSLMGQLITMQIQSFTIVNLVIADNQYLLSELDTTLKLVQPLAQNYQQAKLLKADHRRIVSVYQQLKKE